MQFINHYPQLVQQNHAMHLDHYSQETGDQVMQSLMQAILERDKMSADSLQALLVSDNPVSQQLGPRYLTKIHKITGKRLLNTRYGNS